MEQVVGFLMLFWMVAVVVMLVRTSRAVARVEAIAHEQQARWRRVDEAIEADVSPKRGALS